MKICKQLLLQFLLLAVNIYFWVLVSALNSVGLVQRSSSRFKNFSLGCLVVGSSFIWKKRKISWNGHSLTFVVTRCTTRCHSLSLFATLCHSLSLVVIRCHSLYHSSLVVPLVVIRCHSLYHSLSLVVIRCHSLYHSLSLDVPLVCLFINEPK